MTALIVYLLTLAYLQLCRDIDAAGYAPVDRALVAVEVVHALDRLSVALASLQVIDDVNPADHQHAVILLDLPAHIRSQESLARFDPARLQRAA